MTTCLAAVMIDMQPSLSDRAQLKRVRSASLAAMTEPLKSALKACKISEDSSPQSPREGVPETTKPSPQETAPWPTVSGCEGLSNALMFLQTSRQHAMLLMVQNHWDRAMNVLEKVENASETVYAQRRKLVLAQANSSRSMETPCSPAPQRSIRFHDQVQVAIAPEMDRTASEIESPVREEMLVLRASRAIPRENYSELWC